MDATARGTFEIDMAPAAPELDGAVSRLNFTKKFSGDLEGFGAGLMLSGGDPQKGVAGYVAIETVTGRLGDRDGAFALEQLGLMQEGAYTLHYEVVPGSGSGGLEDIRGTFHLTVGEDGTHSYVLEYRL